MGVNTATNTEVQRSMTTDYQYPVVECDEQVTVEDAPETDPAGQSILDSAIRLLADGGLTTFTIDRLASEARVSKTSIYRRWPDKKAIFRAVLDRWGRRAEVTDVGDFALELDQWYRDRQSTYNAPGFRQVAASLMELAAHDRDSAWPWPQTGTVRGTRCGRFSNVPSTVVRSQGWSTLNTWSSSSSARSTTGPCLMDRTSTTTPSRPSVAWPW